MARTTISEIIEGIRRELNSINRYEVSTLGASIGSTTATSVTLTYTLPPSLRAGAIITVGTETMRVMDIDANAKELTVIRGWEGSTAAVHSLGTEVWINPRFTAAKVFEAMQDEVAGLPETLYRVGEYQADIALGADTVELPAAWSGMYGLIDARKFLLDEYTSNMSPRTTWPRVNGRVQRGSTTAWTDGPTTGVYFRIKRPPSGYSTSATVGHILFQAALPFDLTTFTVDDDLVDDFGMQASMLDVVKMGVKIRLMPDEEIGRSDRRGQDENRRAENVPPGAALRPVQALYSMYLRRRQEEANRLRTNYPIRMG